MEAWHTKIQKQTYFDFENSEVIYDLIIISVIHLFNGFQLKKYNIFNNEIKSSFVN